jgi:hypothetical protein
MAVVIETVDQIPRTGAGKFQAVVSGIQPGRGVSGSPEV